MASCLICKENLGSTYVSIQERGLKTLIESSLKRNDGLHVLFQKADPLQVHEVCHKGYTRQTSIEAAIKKTGGVEMVEDILPPTLRSTVPGFDISSQCIYCGEVIQTSNKVPVK